MKQQPSLFFIGGVWPEPNSSAGGARILQLLKLFHQAGYAITFGSIAQKNEYSTSLSDWKVTEVELQLNHSSFDELIKKTAPDLVIYDRFMTEEQFSWRVKEHSPQSVHILETIDLHSLRQTRQHLIKKPQALLEAHLENEVTLRELASILRCDLSLLISPYEYDFLITHYGLSTNLLHYLPFEVTPLSELELETLPSFTDREDFITIGNFKHPPNEDSVLYLKSTIWPLIKKKLPKAKLKIFGSYLFEKIKQLHDEKEGFLILGRAPDSAEVLKKARVLLAPLRFGAGIKGKLIESMTYHTPSVTTTIGAEGMHDQLPWNGHIADDPSAFAEAAVTLFENPHLWTQANTNGEHLLKTIFKTEEQALSLFEKIQQLQANLNTHRLKNWQGRLLQREQFQSTKYLSKWIEEKNKD